MNRFLFLFVFSASLAPTSLSSQRFSLGLVAGVSRSNQAKLDPATVPDGLTARWAPTLGLFTTADLTSRLGISLEAHFLSKGYWARSYALNMDYLELPLLAQFKLWPHRTVSPGLIAGLSAGLKLECTVDDDRFGVGLTIYLPGYECAGRQTKRWDRGVVLGAGTELNFGRTRFTLQVRFNRALTNVYDPGGGPPSYNQTFSLLFGMGRRP